MQVYLLRHGVAEEGRIGLNDADRALTTDGRRKLRELLCVAAEAHVRPTLVLSSPFKRALQTAEIAVKELQIEGTLLRTKFLIPTATPEQVWDEIRVHKNEPELMLVGHDPLFSNLVGFLLGALQLRIDFKKGSLLRVDFEHFPPHPHGILRWYLTSKLCSRTAQ